MVLIDDEDILRALAGDLLLLQLLIEESDSSPVRVSSPKPAQNICLTPFPVRRGQTSPSRSCSLGRRNVHTGCILEPL